MLELSDQNFFKIMINMKRDLIEKADNMQEQMDNISRDLELQRKNQKMLEIKKHCNRNE